MSQDMPRQIGYINPENEARRAKVLPWIKQRFPVSVIAARAGVCPRTARRWFYAYWLLQPGRHVTRFSALKKRDQALVEQVLRPLNQMSSEARAALVGYLQEELR